MPFTSYATVRDMKFYVPEAVTDLWGGKASDVEEALERASNRLNERLSGLDKFSTIPIEQESSGRYAEVLIQLTVYEAIIARISGTNIGDDFEDQWRPAIVLRNNLWDAIARGEYVFGSEPAVATAGAKAVHLGRVST